MDRESLPPKVLQTVGLLGLIVLGVFWGATGRIEPTLLATAGSLVGIGHYVGAVKQLNGHAKPSNGNGQPNGAHV